MKLHLPVKHLVLFTRTLLILAFFGYAQQALSQHCNPSYTVSITGNTVSFVDQSTADGEITGYTWSFGDGNSSNEQHPVHAYSHAGVYEVCLTIFAHNPDCHATFCHHITIEMHADTCHASYTVVQPDQHHLIFDFTDHSQSNGVIETWEWSFGDGQGSSDQNPTHTYESPGTYMVCLFITDDSGCSSHFCHELVVHHLIEDHCEAAYEIHYVDHDNLSVGFIDQSSTDGHITSWLWDFGDNTTSTEQNPVHLYSAPGTYAVCLFITDDNGCTSHFCHHVTLHHEEPVCEASFYFHQPHENHYTINFTDHSSSDADIHFWLWDFGDGATSSEQNPSHTYDHSGTYLVCLFIATADSSCVDHYCHHVVIHRTILDDHNDDFAQRMASNDNASFQVSGNPSDPETEQGEPLRPKAVVLEDNDSDLSIHLSPNPFSEFIVLEFNLEQDAMVNVTIVDLAGKSVFKNETQFLAKGLFQNQINVGHLSDGVYIFRVEFNGETLIKKVVKTK